MKRVIRAFSDIPETPEFMQKVYMDKVLRKMKELLDTIENCPAGFLDDWDMGVIYHELIDQIPYVQNRIHGDAEGDE